MPAGGSHVAEALEALEAKRAATGEEMMELVRELYPLPRSLTGNGVRDTLDRLGEGLPLERRELASGTPILDWDVPKEWQVRSARLRAPDGTTVVDFSDHNLHLLGYSAPFEGSVSLAELDEHLYSLPDQPDVIPYRTSYYQERWGFCLPHRARESLTPGEYRVEIDTRLFDGAMSWGEVVLPGERESEVLVSAHVCHPSLANDNLSGLAVTRFLARALADLPRRHTWRFVWAPGTVGAIAWLAENEHGAAKRIQHGLIAANLGDPGAFHYKRSRNGRAGIDRATCSVLTARPAETAGAPVLEDFSPFGYDERQYGSPGFDLPVGSLTRTPWGRYPEYHTSADDLDLIRADALAESLVVYLEIAAELESGRWDRENAAASRETVRARGDESPTYRNLLPRGEPQLGRRGLYSTLGGGDEGRERQLAILWVLNQSDGMHSLHDIAQRSGVGREMLAAAAEALLGAGLIEPL